MYQSAKEIAKKGLVVVGGSLAAAPAFALTTAENTAVTDAFTAGGTSVGVVVTGVILIAGAMTGLGLVYSWLKK